MKLIDAKLGATTSTRNAGLSRHCDESGSRGSASGQGWTQSDWSSIWLDGIDHWKTCSNNNWVILLSVIPEIAIVFVSGQRGNAKSLLLLIHLRPRRSLLSLNYFHLRLVYVRIVAFVRNGQYTDLKDNWGYENRISYKIIYFSKNKCTEYLWE